MGSFRGYKRTIKLGFDYDEVKKGVPKASQQMALLNAEFKKASEQAKLTGNSNEFLRLSYEKETEALKINKDKVGALKKELETLENATTKNNRAIADKKIQLANAETAVLKNRNALKEMNLEMRRQNILANSSGLPRTERELKILGVETANYNTKLQLLNAQKEKSIAVVRNYGSKINELSIQRKVAVKSAKLYKEEITRLTQEVERLERVEGKHSQTLYEQKIKLEQAKMAFENAKGEVRKLNDEIEKNADVLGFAKEKWDTYADILYQKGKMLTATVTAPLLAIGTGAFKIAGDYEQAIGKVDAVFKKNKENIKQWADSAMENFGLSRVTAMQMIGDFGALWKTFDVSDEKAEKYSKQLSERVRDLSAFYNVTVEDTKSAMEAIFTGQTMPLRKFGVIMTETNLKQFALTKGIKKRVEAMNEAEKAELRMMYFMEKTSLSIGQYTRERNSALTAVEDFKEALKELGTTFGTEILPIITPFIQKINEMLKAFSNLDVGTKNTIIRIAGIALAIGPVLTGLGLFGKGISGVSSLLNASFFIFGNVSGAVKGVGGVIKGVGAVGKGFLSVLGNSGFFGFAKWALIILAVAVAVGFLIYQINILLKRGKEANRGFDAMKNMENNVNELQNRVQNTKYKSLAIGTVYSQAGRTRLHEYGDETIDLPSGSRVYTAEQSRKMMESIKRDDNMIVNAIEKLGEKLDRLENKVSGIPDRQLLLSREMG